METDLIRFDPQHLKMSLADLLAAGGTTGAAVEQRLAAAVRSRLSAHLGGASDTPLGRLIEDVELPGLASLQDLTLREILEQTVGRGIEPEDAPLQREYERLRERLTETKPVRELLRLDQPIGEHSLFRDLTQSAHVAEVLRLTAFPSTDEHVAAFVAKMHEFNGPSPEFWAAVSADGLAPADVLQRVRETFDLSRLTFHDLPLLRALAGEGITAAPTLIAWDAQRWRQFLDQHDITPPEKITGQDRLREYAGRLEERIAQRFPTAVFFHRLNPGRIDQHADDLRRAALEMPPPSEPEPSAAPAPPSPKQEKFTIGSVVERILEPFLGKDATQAPLTDASQDEPHADPKPADTDATRGVRTLFSGLGLDDILRDGKSSADQKVDRIVQLVRKLDDFRHTNPDLDLLRADFHRDIHVSTEARDQRPVLTLDPNALGELRPGPATAALRDALRTQAKIELGEFASVIAVDGGWRVEDSAPGQTYLMYRSGNAVQVFRGIDWTGVGEDRARIMQQLKVYQRLLRLDPRFETVERLLGAGYDSAWKITLESDTSFLRSSAGDPQQRQAIRHRAYAISEHSTLTYMNAKNAAGNGSFRNAFFENTTGDVTEYLKSIPGYPELFELPRFCDCAHCKSIFGPPAYLVDLMRFIAIEITARNNIDPARSLQARRSDIWDIPLDCENANRLIPYIDIVHDILERRVQAEIGTSPYEYLYTQAVHPFELPFHLPLTQARAYLGHFKLQPLFEIFHAFGRPERWTAMEYLGLSARDFDLITNPSIAGVRLGQAYGVANPALIIPADFWGLVRVDNFLVHTGLTRSELSLLLFQNLDTNERAIATGPLFQVNDGGDRQADFFINNVHDNAPSNARLGSMAITVNRSNPSDVHEELQNLSARKLGRIHRFIRLARRLRWTFEDLDWVLCSIGKTGPNQDIDDDAITRLFKIKRWQDRFEQPLDVLASLWFDMKSVGRKNPDGPEPRDLFNRVFNNPRVRRGAPAYDPTSGSALLLRRFDRTRPVDPNRGWLLAALELTNEELNQIAATMPANPVPLTLANLSYLFRISRLPKIVGLTVWELLLFLAARGVAMTQVAINAHLQDFDAFEQSLELLAWAKAADWSIDTLDYLRTNQPNEFVDPGFHADDVGTLIEGLSNNPLVQDKAFTALPSVTVLPETRFTALPGVNAAQSQALFAELETKGFIARAQPVDAFGRLTAAFTPDVPSFTLGLTAPYNDPAKEMQVMNLLRLYYNPTLQQPALTVVPGVDEAQSQALFDELEARGFIARAQPDDAFGRLTVKFTPDDPTFTLGLNPPYDYPDEEMRVINLLRQYHNLTMPEAARRQRILEGLASFFGIAPELAAALIGFTNEPLTTAWTAILTTTVNSDDADYPNIVRFLRKLHTRILVAARLGLRVDEITGIATNAAVFGLGQLDTLPVTVVRNLHRYRTLTDKFGDGDGRLLQFIAGQPADPALLAALTGWERAQIEAVAAALVNNLGLNHVDEIYRSIDGLDRLARCFALIGLLSVDARTLLDWSDWNNKTWAQQEAVARAALDVFKARYGEDAWVKRFEPVEDQVREMKRDALASWLTWRYRPNAIRDREDLYQFLLIDVNMTSCEKISRIKEALNALQLYVHRCLMNLESDEPPKGVSPDTIRKQWQWMKNYRVWEANRKVFLYPENYIEPELRDDKTTLYRELEDELLQGDVTKATVEAAYRNYLDKLAEIANLTIAGSYYHEEEDPETGTTRTIYLIGRTRTAPHQFYHRQYINEIRWTPWERIELTIKSDYVSPIVAFQRLFIFWVEITKKQRSQIVAGNSTDPVDEYTASIFYSFRSLNERWTPPQLLRSNIQLRSPLTRSAERFHPGFHYLDFQAGTLHDDRVNGVYPNAWVRLELRENLMATDEPYTDRSDPLYFPQYLNTTDSRHTPDSRLVESGYGGLATHSQDYVYARMLELQDETLPASLVSNPVLNNVSPDQAHAQVVNNAFDWNRSRFIWTIFDNGDEQFLIRTVDNSEEVEAFRDFNEVFPAPYKYQFQRISTSIVRELSRRLLAGGVEKLLSVKSQQLSELPFNRLSPSPRLAIAPQPRFPIAYHSDELDFGGAFGQYYKEVFFHIPCLIANRLNANQQFEDAQRWYHYVFDPTAAEANATLVHPHDRYWRHLPFRNQTLPSFQDALNNNPAALDVYHENPFQPHAIARLRIGAYPKNVVMKYIDNLIDWAEDLFRQGTWESITEGTMLYVMAYQILGATPPEQLDPCEDPPSRTYRELSATAIPEFLIEIENASTFQPGLLFSGIGGAASPGGLSINPNLLDNLVSTTRNSSSLLYFCFPENQQLRDYWRRVTDGLFKIRHCLDITGKRRQLALYEPAIDPAALVRAVAGGRDLGAVLADLRRPLPHYRFVHLIEKARQFAAQVSQFGGALLAALEKKDAEELAQLRTTHEGSIQNLTLVVREKQRDAAVESHAALLAGRASAETRQRHYNDLLAKGLSRHEELQLASMMIAGHLDRESQRMNQAAALAHLLPQLGSPFAISFGGREIGTHMSAAADGIRMKSSATNLIGSMSSITGGYRRREQDWSLQHQLAGYDVDQITRQIATADLQRESAEQEIKILTRAQEQTDEMQAFLENKFTRKDLYQWMSGHLAGLYFQSYQLAVDLAKSAERAFQYERNTNETHIQFGHWDSLKKGLLAGERLTLELNQLEKAYLDGNARTLEIEKHISLAQLDPEQLFKLKTTGVCEFNLPEILFDHDFPGHYCRKIKTVALSIPAVVGPYESVKATLTQLGNSTVLRPDAVACEYLLTGAGNQPDDSVLRVDWRPNEEIAISSANNDAGTFELSFRDERYLPFEGTGAVSRWRLTMLRQTNRLNFDTISDVVMHLRYTALSGGDTLHDAIVKIFKDAKLPLSGFRMFSVRHEFSAAWQRFMHPAAGALVHRLEIPISPQLFPANVRITAITRVFLFLEADPGILPPGAPGLTISLQPAGARLTAPGNANASFVFTNRFIESLELANVDRALSGPWIAQIDRTAIPPALRRQEQIGGKPHYFLDDARIVNLGLILAYEGNVGWS